MKLQTLLAIIFMLLIIIVFIVFTFYFINALSKYLRRKKRTKISLKLMEVGYTPISFDADGNPYFVKRGSHIDTITNIYKAEKQKL